MTYQEKTEAKDSQEPVLGQTIVAGKIESTVQRDRRIDQKQ
jgi:hypothetical protein